MTCTAFPDITYDYQPAYWGKPQFFHDFRTTAKPSVRAHRGKLQVSAAYLCHKFGIAQYDLVQAVIRSGRYQRSLYPNLDCGLWLGAEDVQALINAGLRIDTANQARIMRLLGA